MGRAPEASLQGDLDHGGVAAVRENTLLSMSLTVQ